ncbi:30S ribosomal protein S18 [bacterium B17]|nr:30S ribosomal protein S18 [bacterium B17]
MARMTKGKRRPRRNLEPPVRKRSRYLDGDKDIDINNVELLKKFVTEHGKIIPARMTGASAKQQRQIKHGVRRARNMGLMA